ncbi:MAG TPA: sigma-70 family RNA polymerase sigma factor [Dongiaceae bacterium]|nr:sigma-70 family RNA polymerase sigma factor [Dongiaceae bacterium]
MNSIENQKMRFPEQNRAGGLPEAEVREDVQLLALIAGENQHALAALYRRRSGLLYSLLVRMLGNEMEAQEVLQDVFVQVWRRAPDYDPGRASPVAWMILIARGRAVDRLRSRSRRNAGQAAYEQEVISLEMEVNATRQPERDELAAACTAALHQLPEAQGEVLQLAFLRGWTHEEIAAAAGEPLGTIKARIRRGLLALRQTLKDYHG